MTAEEPSATDGPKSLEFRQIVEFLESQDTELPVSAMDTTELFKRFPRLAEVDVRDVVVEGPHGEVPGCADRGTQEGSAGFVWVHGGAFIGGDLDMPEAHWLSLAVAANGFAVLSLDYHKALRGIHYPVPSDDILAGWLWATDHAGELGVGPRDLHLGGASAGANLVAGVTKPTPGRGWALACLRLARGNPIVHPELPPLPAELPDKLETENPDVPFPVETVREFNLQYAGSESVLSDPYAFAANGPLAGQPPVYILN